MLILTDNHHKVFMFLATDCFDEAVQIGHDSFDFEFVTADINHVLLTDDLRVDVCADNGICFHTVV